MINFFLQSSAVNERQIGTPEDVLGVGKLLQRAQSESRSRACDFVVKRTQRRDHAGDALGAPVAFHHRDSLREKRHGATAMRDDETNIRTAPDDTHNRALERD